MKIEVLAHQQQTSELIKKYEKVCCDHKREIAILNEKCKDFQTEIQQQKTSSRLLEEEKLEKLRQDHRQLETKFNLKMDELKKKFKESKIQAESKIKCLEKDTQQLTEKLIERDVTIMELRKVKVKISNLITG